MAETRPAQGNSAEPTTTSAPPQKASSTRMLILLGILAIVVGAYAHDYFVATPAAKKADEDLRQLVDERNAMGVKEGKLVVSQDVQDLLGYYIFTLEQNNQADEVKHLYRLLANPEEHFVKIARPAKKQ